ncbi:hypothetical protein jhhlp_004928 [Lomentospora prolificans]|uniref:Uncharacterized protein n=1 Tax=Lomentospora prolificans TaxID=41688 RepID=A0A2N3N852_9PEZI|nr:hypothetical protein jhhlp_004928 [Lomentospora prolificans]
MANHGVPFKIVAVIGVGGMGVAIARRIGSGRKLFLADYSTENLQKATENLRGDGFNVETHQIDVADAKSVTTFAETVASQGTIEAVVHTAGVSPVQAELRRVLDVDLVGTAQVLDAFYQVACPGMSVVCIASMAGHAIQLPAELERHLATAPTDKLLEHGEIDKHGALTYSLAKRGNILRVQASAPAWGLKGARINTVSPGVISTAMGQQELQGPHGALVQRLVDESAVGRIGTPEDVARAVAFLVSPESSFITGTDLLVDGGSVSSQKWGN